MAAAAVATTTTTVGAWDADDDTDVDGRRKKDFLERMSSRREDEEDLETEREKEKDDEEDEVEEGGRKAGGGGGCERLQDKTSIYDRSQDRRINTQLLSNFKGFLLHLLLLCPVPLSICCSFLFLLLVLRLVYASSARSPLCAAHPFIGLYAAERLEKAT